MIAVDTNVIVRLLTQDDDAQYQRSLRLFEKYDIFTADTVILETEWVLRFAYKFSPVQICAALRNLMGLPNVCVMDAALIQKVLEWHENGLDFADALHLAKSQSCDAFYTFDTKFISRAVGLTDYDICQP